MFSRLDLRTIGAAAARAFYAAVLGHDRSVIWELHEQALARGARPHWLGELGVADALATTAAFVARGAIQYSPPRAREGGHVAVLRDPGGALLAVGSPAATAPAPEVAWLVLRTADVARAIADYRELFGLEVVARVDLGAEGEFAVFTWGPGGSPVGAIGGLRPGVHPQWLYFFAVPDLDAALAAVRAGGGVALAPTRPPNGARACVCEDPLGAAFGLWEHPPAAARG